MPSNHAERWYITRHRSKYPMPTPTQTNQVLRHHRWECSGTSNSPRTAALSCSNRAAHDLPDLGKVRSAFEVDIRYGVLLLTQSGPRSPQPFHPVQVLPNDPARARSTWSTEWRLQGTNICSYHPAHGGAPIRSPMRMRERVARLPQRCWRGRRSDGEVHQLRRRHVRSYGYW
jgi:hypothetical protein